MKSLETQSGSRLKVVIIPVTPLQQNCSLLIDTSTNDAIVVDPGGDADLIFEAAQKFKAKVRGVWLTHSHFDHCGAVAECLARCDRSSQTPELIEPELIGHADPFEQMFRQQTPAIAAKWGLTGFSVCPEPTRFVVGGETLHVGTVPCTVLFVPGHSPGHVCFYFKAEKTLIAGDTVFSESIGRTDLPGGNHNLLLDSIKREIFALPDDVIVYPGHGPTTTVGRERRANPFLQ